MQIQTKLFGAMALALSISSLPAYAQDENAGAEDGTASASVVAPSRVTKIADLRFGAFASPSGASTLRVAVDGSVTPTGDVATALYVDQPPEGRGPAQFKIEQDGSFFIRATFPREVVVTNGTSSMTVDQTTARFVITSFDPGGNSELRLDMGGTLNIDANQEPGSYSGDFLITVTYF